MLFGRSLYLQMLLYLRLPSESGIRLARCSGFHFDVSVLRLKPLPPAFRSRQHRDIGRKQDDSSCDNGSGSQKVAGIESLNCATWTTLFSWCVCVSDTVAGRQRHRTSRNGRKEQYFVPGTKPDASIVLREAYTY